MSNMSYCRFENTTRDMSDCMDALEEADWNMDSLKQDASEDYEQPAMDRFIKLCRRVVKIMGETERKQNV